MNTEFLAQEIHANEIPKMVVKAKQVRTEGGDPVCFFIISFLITTGNPSNK